jgi:hypothetical protein
MKRNKNAKTTKAVNPPAKVMFVKNGKRRMVKDV